MTWRCRLFGHKPKRGYGALKFVLHGRDDMYLPTRTVEREGWVEVCQRCDAVTDFQASQPMTPQEAWR